MPNQDLPIERGVRETELVAEFCTCGAQLPPDALFCHKCGKPQREIGNVETPSPVVEPNAAPAYPAEPVVVAPVAPSAPPEIGFHNGQAVRSAFLAAALSSLLIFLPTPIYLAAPWMLLWLMFAGFLAVRFYLRRTGLPVSVRGGFRMGWITGIFCFVIAMVSFTITIISIATQEGGLAAFYRKQFTGRVPAGVDLNQMLAMLESPTGLGMMLTFALMLLFLIYTLLPTVGGGLAARIMDRGSSTR